LEDAKDSLESLKEAITNLLTDAEYEDYEFGDADDAKEKSESACSSIEEAISSMEDATA